MVRLLILLSLLIPLTAEAQTRVERRYYDVRGTTVQELMAGTSSLSPLGVTALTQIVPGQARWQARQGRGGYVIDRFEANATIVQTFPRWVDRNRAPRCLRREWDRMMQALIRHEDVHRDRYLAYTREFQRQATRLPPQPSPAVLQRVLTALNQRLESEAIAWQQDYDRRTDHGRREGVILRPC